MFTPLPPLIVPTFIVGEPMTGCGAAAKSKRSSSVTARAAL